MLFPCKSISLESYSTLVSAIPPSFAHFPLPKTMVTSEGGNLTIPCTPEAAPQPLITWSQNGADIGYGDARRQVLNDGTLHVTEITRGDQGLYTCKATNDQGEAQSSTQVTIMSMSVLIK